jgi:hypothetical protein
MSPKDWAKMSREDLFYIIDWAQKIGFHFLAKELYKEMINKGFIKEDNEKTNNRR